MGGRRTKQQPSRAVVEAQEAGRTARSIARWDASKKIVPALCALGGTIFSAQVATDHTLNVALGLLLLIGTAASVTKILWDRSQKQRQRQRIAVLESENRSLFEERGRLRGELAALERLLGSGTGQVGSGTGQVGSGTQTTPGGPLP